MNKWNNYETLEHHKGMIWVGKLIKTENKGNICVNQNGEFRVIAYVSPDMLEHKDLDTMVAEVVTAEGTQYLLEEDETKITCSICGNTYDELMVNIVDYPDDVCLKCESQYRERAKEYCEA
ncbi:hypothetical protein ACQKNX_22925 [Lysinibacillus sp. NPDC093712]|uniref:hypothetical protein n=1 Tax=Lysinibacillus sp. NPDC093712 TaxID=3390579 RepID=UPI003CFCE8E1